MDVNQSGRVERRRTPLGVIAAIFVSGLVVGMIVAGFHVAGAQTPSPSPSAPAGKQFRGLGRGFGHKGFGRGGIHGVFTVPAPGGGYETVSTQIGEVTSVGSSSITVKSEDGYTHTYAVDNDTLVAAGNNGIADVAKGDTVRVLAIDSGGTSHAKQIADATKMQQLRQKYWAPRHKQQPSPSGSASATSLRYL
ncbi:MAG: hypothetical protein ACXVQY_09310 [Actinomycetota bacterium]